MKVGGMKQSNAFMINEAGSATVCGPWAGNGVVRKQREWSRFAVHESRTTSRSLLTSKPDEARLLHLPDPVLRARAAVSLCRWQRGRRATGLLPAARGAPLRHVCANHGHESGLARRSNARPFRAIILPALSRSRTLDADAGSRAHGCAGQVPHRTGIHLNVFGRTVAGLLSSELRSRRTRTSSHESKLRILLNNRP